MVFQLQSSMAGDRQCGKVYPALPFLSMSNKQKTIYPHLCLSSIAKTGDAHIYKCKYYNVLFTAEENHFKINDSGFCVCICYEGQTLFYINSKTPSANYQLLKYLRMMSEPLSHRQSRV